MGFSGVGWGGLGCGVVWCRLGCGVVGLCWVRRLGGREWSRLECGMGGGVIGLCYKVINMFRKAGI